MKYKENPEALEKLKDLISNSKTIIVRNATQVDQELLNCTKTLQGIVRLGVGLDNINSYYDVNMKLDRLAQLKGLSETQKGSFFLNEISLENLNSLENLFKDHNPSHVVNLAAQAGVRFSLKQPQQYIESNLIGFFNILDLSLIHI